MVAAGTKAAVEATQATATILASCDDQREELKQIKSVKSDSTKHGVVGSRNLPR